MPIKNILLPDYNFVYTRYYGSVDDLQVRAYSDQLKNQIAEFKSCCEIIDFSKEIDFSDLSSETLTRAGSLEKERPTASTGPLAILVVNPLTYGLARAYSTFAAEARSDLLISYSLDDCIAFMGLNNIQSQQVQNAINMSNPEISELQPGNSIGFNFPPDN